MSRKKKPSARVVGGYSFAEVILAAFVLVVGVGAAYGAIVTGVRTSQGARDIIAASGLAQEGVELVLNVRDNAYAAGFQPFHKFPAGDEFDCRLDINDAIYSYNESDPDGDRIPNSDETIVCDPTVTSFFDLTIGPSLGFIIHRDVEGKFERRIFIRYVSAERRDVYSVVTWGDVKPSDDAALVDCTRENRCAYAQIALIDWR